MGSLRSIMGHTLFLLMSALKTENVTVLLDSCYAGGALRGNTEVRALKLLLKQDANSPQVIPTTPSEDLAYQKTWLTKLGLSAAQFKQQRKLGLAKGAGIGAAQSNQESLDVPFEGFSAGGFTYLLTRYLWQLPITTTPQPLDTLFTNLVLSTQLLSKGTQVPLQEVRVGSTNNQQPIFFAAASRPAAEAVIHEDPQPGQPIKFWLVGVSPTALASYQTGAVFNLIDAQGQTIGELEQTTARVGLEAAGKLRSGSKVQLTTGMCYANRFAVSLPTPS